MASERILSLDILRRLLVWLKVLFPPHSLNFSVKDFKTLLVEQPKVDEESAINLKNDSLISIPDWYPAMHNDVERGIKYSNAIEQVVKPFDTVLDIGAGLGVLTLPLSRKAGQVIACEKNPEIAKMLKKNLSKNGVHNNVSVISTDSKILDEKTLESITVITTEIFDCGGVGEGIIPTLRAAKEKIPKLRAIIPSQMGIEIALIESKEIHDLHFVKEMVSGDDFSLINPILEEKIRQKYSEVKLNKYPHKLLNKPVEALNIDLLNDPLNARSETMSVEIIRPGICHAVVFWFKLNLSDGVTLENSPNNTKSHWSQAVQCFLNPIQVKEGEFLNFIVHQTDDNVYFELKS